MKVKIFDCDSIHLLEIMLNEFIEEIEKKDMEVKGIKFSTPHDGCSHSYSALVMYVPDEKIYLHTGLGNLEN